MSNQKMYQLTETDNFKLTFTETTIEQATDQLYSINDIKQEWNNDEPIPTPYYIKEQQQPNLIEINTYWDSSYTFKKIKYLQINDLINYIKPKLKNNKDRIDFELDELDYIDIQKLNKIFKQYGIIYSYKNNHFKKFKQTTTIKKQSNHVPKSLLLDLKRNTIYYTSIYLNDQHNININFKNVLSHKEMDSTLSFILNHLPITIEQILTTLNFGHNMINPISKWITYKINSNNLNCTIDQVISEYTKFLKSLIK